MEIRELVKEAYDNAVEKGFWEEWDKLEMCCRGRKEAYKQNAISTRLMLIVSELGEALEALRHNDMKNFKEELADVAIRLGDLCGGLDIDLEAEIIKKMEKNRTRPYKHGKAF